MASISTIQDGDWNTASTWGTGTVPGASDHAVINHAVTISSAVEIYGISIGTSGSLTIADSFGFTTALEIKCRYITMTRKLHDDRRINLDGAVLTIPYPTLSCLVGAPDGFPATPSLQGGNSDYVVFDEPGFISSSARLRDILPEGCAPAYAEKISNAVRYITVTVHIKASRPYYLGSLYRMARSPFQVLLATETCVIKGFIENVTPDPGSIGKEYITVKVTIAEGPGA